MSEEKITIGKAIKILRGFHQKDCYSDTPLNLAIPFIIKYIRDVEQQLKDKDEKISKVIEYATHTKFGEITAYDTSFCEGVYNVKEKVLKILETNRE